MEKMPISVYTHSYFPEDHTDGVDNDDVLAMMIMKKMVI
jgi:hypothetical protein